MGNTERAMLTRDAISAAALAGRLPREDVGAVATFEGVVRGERRADGVALAALEYQAYDPMAVEQMSLLCEKARRDFAIIDAAVAHRVGEMKTGEVSVAIAVVAAHRDAAFEACRWLIDAIKVDVPIWKKDVWADGRREWTPAS